MKRIAAIIVVFLILAVRPAFAEREQAAYCVTEQRSGQIICESGAGEQYFPAGLTKLMSYLLFYEALDAGEVSQSDRVQISKTAASRGGASVFLDAGAEYSFSELLHAAVISSGNDATVALAEHVAGSEEAFVERMNRRAEELGLACNFADATGLSEKTRASAGELARIAAELADHGAFFEASGVWTETFVHESGRETELTNANRLIKNQLYDGMATGSAKGAGYCLAASMPKSGSRFLCIILHAENSTERFQIAEEQLSAAAAEYLPHEIVSAGVKVKTVAIPGAREKETALYAAEDLCLLLPKDLEVRKSIYLREDLAAPLRAGESVGELIVTASDGSSYAVELIVRQDLEDGSLRSSLSRILALWMTKKEAV